jgi:hypothetical protein
MRQKDKRPSARARGYDRQWQQLRRAVLASEPMCRVHGCGRRAEHVDPSRTRHPPTLRLSEKITPIPSTLVTARRKSIAKPIWYVVSAAVGMLSGVPNLRA